jgi:hypothetical protein
MTDPDEPMLDDIADDDPAWQRQCPKCGAEPEIECTSLVSGCCIDGIHAERRAEPQQTAE